MTDRDALATLIMHAADATTWDDYTRVADEIIAAGWRAPERMITTKDELSALGERAIVRDANKDTYCRYRGMWYRFGAMYGFTAVALPATVIVEGDQSAPMVDPEQIAERAADADVTG